MLDETETVNFALFRDCFSSAILQRVSRSASKTPRRSTGRGIKSRKNAIGASAATPSSAEGDQDEEELADFIEFLAWEVFAILPSEQRRLSYATIQNDARQAEKYRHPDTASLTLPSIPPSVLDSVEAYDLLPPSLDLSNLISSVISDYITATTAPPPIWSNTRASACEICDRDWIPLTYHHLIPKQVHEKVLKRRWHEEWVLNSVAWLCPACHRFVHRLASNEVLAKELYTVDRLLEKEEVQAWARWVGRVRWKAR